MCRTCSSPTTCLPWRLLKCSQGSRASSKTPAASPKLSWMTSGYGKDIISSVTSCSGKPHSLRLHLKCLWRRWDRQKKPGNASCLMHSWGLGVALLLFLFPRRRGILSETVKGSAQHGCALSCTTEEAGRLVSVALKYILFLLHYCLAFLHLILLASVCVCVFVYERQTKSLNFLFHLILEISFMSTAFASVGPALSSIQSFHIPSLLSSSWPFIFKLFLLI